MSVRLISNKSFLKEKVLYFKTLNGTAFHWDPEFLFLFCMEPCKQGSQPHVVGFPELIEPLPPFVKKAGHLSVRQLVLGNKLVHSEMNWGSCVLIHWPTPVLSSVHHSGTTSPRPPMYSVVSYSWEHHSNLPLLHRCLFLLWGTSALLWGHGVEKTEILLRELSIREITFLLLKHPQPLSQPFPLNTIWWFLVRYPEGATSPSPVKALARDKSPVGLKVKWKEKKSQPSREELGERSCARWCSTVLRWTMQDMDFAHKGLSFGQFHFTQNTFGNFHKNTTTYGIVLAPPKL